MNFIEHEVAAAIKIVQEKTGCRVLLEPVLGRVVDSADQPSAVSQTAAVPATKNQTTNSVSRRAVKNVAKAAASKAAKPVTKTKTAEPVAVETFVSVPKFAEMAKISTQTVYNAIKSGKIAADMVRTGITGFKEINSKAMTAWDSADRRPRVSVECVETGMKYPTMAAAAREMKLAVGNISRALKLGVAAGGFHFKFAT